jgi:smad nuclear-interacting protein 1
MKKSTKTRSRSRSPIQRPSFEPSGILAKHSNSRASKALKYTEPPDAHRPTTHWRVFIFKDEEEYDPIDLHTSSFYLIGRDIDMVDILVANPSASKQHAAFQFRMRNGKVCLYIIDLQSTNGTFLNDEQIQDSRYYQVRNKDVITFGQSKRKYVMIEGESLKVRKK